VPARQMLDDMIEESQPYCHSQSDTEVDGSLPRLNPVQLCNLAWQQFEKEPTTYRHWERSSIQGFLRVC
ncbi:MAG: hypothetical protein U0R78_00050, partial [Nocardioidaceae bacterium]